MSDINVTIPGGKAKRLKTAGKYCEQDIVVTAEKPMPLTEKEVNFYDFDGTLLYAYTIEEAQALTELPPLPTQPGLTCQGWNWTLEQLQKYPLPIDVGAVYNTDDGATRLVFYFMSERTTSVSITFQQSKEHGTRVNWGDGSDVETYAGTGVLTAIHKYPLGGYTASFLPDEDCTIRFAKGASGADNNLLGTAISNGTINTGSVLKRVHFGKNTTKVDAAAFRSLRSLEGITLSTSITQISWNAFENCSSLTFFVVPHTVSYINPMIFAECRALRNVVFPGKGIGRGTSDIFNACLSLEKIWCIGSGSTYTRIGYSLYNLVSVVFWDNVAEINVGFDVVNGTNVEMYVLAETPPVLSSSAFLNLGESSVIHIRKGTLDLYKNDTNWTALADLMEELPW